MNPVTPLDAAEPSHRQAAQRLGTSAERATAKRNLAAKKGSAAQTAAGAAPKRLRRVAFLTGGAQPVGRDSVVSFHHGNPAKLVDTNINIGDTFVFEATLRLLDFEEAVFPSPDWQNLDRAVEELNGCDAAVLRGSNYIHGNMSWGPLGAAMPGSDACSVAHPLLCCD